MVLINESTYPSGFIESNLTELNLISSKKSYIAGTSDGTVMVFDTLGKSNKLEFNTQRSETITALASDANKQVAVAYDTHVCIASVSNTSFTSSTSLQLSVVREYAIRCTLPITHLEYSPNVSKTIFVSSKEPDLLIYDFETDKIIYRIDTRNVGVRMFRVSPCGKFVAILDENANIAIHKLEYDEGSGPKGSSIHGSDRVYSVPDVVSQDIVRNYTYGCGVDWKPESKLLTLAIPCNDGNIMFLALNEHSGDGTDWEESYMVTTDEENDEGPSQSQSQTERGAAGLLRFSSSGKLLLSSTDNNNVEVWDVEADQLIKKHKIDAAVVDMKWSDSPGENFVLIMTKDKYFQIDEAIPADTIGKIHSDPVVAVPSVPEETASSNTGASVDDDDLDFDALAAAALDDDDDGNVTTVAASAASAASATNAASAASATDNDKMQEAVPSIRPRHSSSMWSEFDAPSRTKVNAALSTTDVDVDTTTGLNDSNSDNNNERGVDSGGSNSDKIDALPDWADDEEVEESLEAIKQATMGKSQDNGDDGADENFNDVGFAQDDNNDDSNPGDLDASGDINGQMDPSMTLNGPTVMLKAPIMPSSTTPDEKKRKFLVWNAFGYIVSRDEGMTRRCDITVFADLAGQPRQDSFPDNYGFSRASIGPQGAVFSADPDVADIEKNNGSTIHYHAFNGFRMNETFDVTLKDGETVYTVAVGTGWIAATTSKQQLHVWSSTGLQLFTCWLKGPVACIVGSGLRLAIIYYSSTPCNDRFFMSVDVLEVGIETCIRQLCSCELPLLPGSAVEWCGFCPSTGILGVMDDNGVLSVLLKAAGWQWIPVVDTTAVRRQQKIYWPICIIEGEMQYALLNGRYKPDVYPLPTPARINFQVPIAGGDKDELKSSYIWETSQAKHLESIKAELDTLQVLPDGYTLDMLEENVDQQATAADAACLKLLQVACRTGKNAQSFDLAKRLRTERAVKAAIKISDQLGQPALASYLEVILRNKLEFNRVLQEAALAAQATILESSNISSSSRSRINSTSNTYNSTISSHNSHDDSRSSQGSYQVSPEMYERENVNIGRRRSNSHDGNDYQPASALKRKNDHSSTDTVVTPAMQGKSVRFDVDKQFQPTGDMVEPSSSLVGALGAGFSMTKHALSPIRSPNRGRLSGSSRDSTGSNSNSPSPIKTPKLQRQSSYTEQARSRQQENMNIL